MRKELLVVFRKDKRGNKKDVPIMRNVNYVNVAKLQKIYALNAADKCRT
jgi:hypothetical protein